MKLSMCYYGNPILRRKTKAVTEVTEETRELVAEMIRIMEAQKGLGLAAPQVGVSLSLFVSIVYPDQEDGEPTYGAPRVFINPVISHPSSATNEKDEGCLSIPGLYAHVIRPNTIEFEAQDLEGKVYREQLNGFFARVCMHEVDHLNGILYIDRIKGKARTALEPTLRRIKTQVLNLR